MAKANDAQQDPSMEQILQTIRGVISGEEGTSGFIGDNDSVLELTEMVEEDGSITSLKPTMSTSQPVTSGAQDGFQQSADVLANIDNMLGEEDTSTNVPIVPEEVTNAEIQEPATAVQEPAPQAPLSQNEVEAMFAEPEETATPPENEEPVVESAPAPEPKAEKPSVQTMAVQVNEEEEETLPDTSSATTEQTLTTEEQKALIAKKNQLISEEAAKASATALSALIHSLPKHKVDGPSFQSGLTLEALVVEALKPELSAWLDKNLPALVTQIVEKEIRRLLPQSDD